MTTTTTPTCPHCSEPLRSGTEGTRKVWACLAHGIIEPPETRLTQTKLPGLDRGRQSVLVKEKEEPVMQRIIGALRRADCNVLCTVHRHTRHTCSECKHNEWHSGGYGSDPGVPDLLVRRPDWPEWMWLGLETKGPTTALNPAQAALLAAGAIVVVRSEAEAVDAVCRADECLKATLSNTLSESRT